MWCRVGITGFPPKAVGKIVGAQAELVQAGFGGFSENASAYSAGDPWVAHDEGQHINQVIQPVADCWIWRASACFTKRRCC